MQSTGSILVVDNDAPTVDLILEVLTDEDYIAYSAPDGVRALAAITRLPPALILLDLRMPGMSGAELIAQLRSTSLATMPIVLMTASPRDAVPLVVPGAIEYLAKPFDIDDLLACVTRYVRPAQAAQQPAVLRAATVGLRDLPR